nr:MAG TPA: SEA domain [Caudoviricetes sp.]
MASLDGTLTITNSEYRPCVVDRKKAMFHRWESLLEHEINRRLQL